MDKATIFRCLAASLVVALFASFASTTLYAPAAGESVIDFSNMDSRALENLTQEEVFGYANSLSMKKLTGFERFFYAFTHPQALYFYLMATLTWFIGLLIATIAVSYWNNRTFNKSLKSDAASGAL